MYTVKRCLNAMATSSASSTDSSSAVPPALLPGLLPLLQSPRQLALNRAVSRTQLCTPDAPDVQPAALNHQAQLGKAYCRINHGEAMLFPAPSLLFLSGVLRLFIARKYGTRIAA